MKNAFHIPWIFICLLSNSLPAQNAPITTVRTLSTVGSTAIISIGAANFSNISSCNLELHYDSTIARATAVETGPLLGGNLNSNLSVPGKISLGWYIYPGVSLTGEPVLFNITFSKADTGKTAITWSDDNYSCVWYDGNFNLLNDLPASTYYTSGALTFLASVAPVITAPVLRGYAGGNIDIPVKVAGFNDVGKFTLTLHYSSPAITWQSFTGDAGFPGLTIDGSTPGTIVASGVVSTGVSGITLPDSATLFTLHFSFSGGSTPLAWSDNGTSCEFFGPPPGYIPLTDVPQNKHYVDGSVTVIIPFGIPFPGEGTNGNGDEPSLILKSFPNPFSGKVTLIYFLPLKGQVLLEIMNMMGEKVITLVDQVEQEGDHSLQVPPASLIPGFYTVRMMLTTYDNRMTRSIKIIKGRVTE